MKKLIQEIIEKLTSATEPTIIPFDHEDIDNFVSNGGDIKKAMIVHSLSEIDDHHYVKTKHGFIGFYYNPYLPPRAMWIVDKPFSEGSQFRINMPSEATAEKGKK